MSKIIGKMYKFSFLNEIENLKDEIIAINSYVTEPIV